jgi:ribosomal protein S4
LKNRLDQILIRRKIAPTIETARAMIIAGEVYIKEQVSDKPGRLCSTEVSISIKEKCRYVSRGGLKLEKALSHFRISPSDLITLDIASPGFACSPTPIEGITYCCHINGNVYCRLGCIRSNERINVWGFT